MSTAVMGGGIKPEIRPVPISAIQKEPRARYGIALDPGRVTAFANFMRTGVIFPPIRIWTDGVTYWLADVLYQLTAAEQAGMVELLCEVRAGTLGDAEWDSLGSGRIHAWLSPAEVRNFLALALQHPIAATLTDSQIASHLGVAASFVRYWKRRFSSAYSVDAVRTADISDEAVLKAISYMRANLGSDLSVPKLARQIGVSPSHLSRRFRLAARTSPKVMLADLRMERARELLNATDLAIKEIAGQLGYSGLSAFGRAFQRDWGVAPKHFKRLAEWKKSTVTEMGFDGRESTSRLQRTMTSWAPVRVRATQMYRRRTMIEIGYSSRLKIPHGWVNTIFSGGDPLFWLTSSVDGAI